MQTYEGEIWSGLSVRLLTDSTRKNSDTRKLLALIPTHGGVLHLSRHVIFMTYEQQTVHDSMAIDREVRVSEWQRTTIAGNEQQWRGNVDDELSSPGIGLVRTFPTLKCPTFSSPTLASLLKPTVARIRPCLCRSVRSVLNVGVLQLHHIWTRAWTLRGFANGTVDYQIVHAATHGDWRFGDRDEEEIGWIRKS